MQDRQNSGPGYTFLSLMRLTIAGATLAVLPAAANGQYAQPAPASPQGYPAQAPQGYPAQAPQQGGQHAPQPQAWSYQNPPPVPGQVQQQESRGLAQQQDFKAGFNESTSNYHNTPAQTHIPIWNGNQWNFVRGASAFLRNYASEVSILTEQATASHNNTVEHNGALAGGSYVFSSQAKQALDNFMINFPFADLAARAGRNPAACGVPQSGGDPVNFPANNTDPTALRIRDIRTADYANHVADCLDETVPPEHGISALGGHLHLGIQAPAAQGPGWTLQIANRVSFLADRLMETRGTFENIVRANAVLSPEDAAALWQTPPRAELQAPATPGASKLPDLARGDLVPKPQLVAGQ